MSHANKVYNVEDALNFIIDGDQSDFDSSDDEELECEQSIVEPDIQGDEPESCSSSSDEEESVPTRVPPKLKEIKWQKVAFDAPVLPFVPTPLEPPAVYDMTPYQYFKLFATDEMLESAALETNLYSTQKRGVSINTSAPEFEQVMGMYLRMGLAQMPNVRAYWDDHYRYPLVADVMSRTRLKKLMCNIHFVNNLSVSEEGKSDKIWKIRPWLSTLRETFLKVSPEEYHSVDEIMVAFKG